MSANEEDKKELQNADKEDSEPGPPLESSSSDSDSDSEPEPEPDWVRPPRELLTYTRPDGTTRQFYFDDSSENSPEANVARLTKILKDQEREQIEAEYEHKDRDEIWDFPLVPDDWKEEDLKELWADRPTKINKAGWDPNWVDEEEIEVIREEIKKGGDPPIAPFYLPYRKYYPVIPKDFKDMSTPHSLIEELDRIEEFLTWVSYIFSNGNSYEGTVWDDMAHGKGVFVAERGLVRYEGEWVKNDMEGHGVVEVDIPTIEPVPGSKLEAKMRAQGKIISRDFMSPEDREWLEMDIEDSLKLADGEYEIPFYEKDEWIREFGEKPEKGRYRYAGQWKHGRMHGCGVYEVNERTTWGRFYFGELLDDPYGCDEETSALHAGIAEVAAAKARMFVNKPDGMVREDRGPYSDPQHPYFYEEEDVWMAPGFINQFYEVPDYWKTYVHEVDQEREMWLNSFYRAPLRLPMPSELEYWWAKDEDQEFILINKEPEPDPKDPSKLIYTEDPLILHTPSGRIINYVEDEEHGIRLFWQPTLKEGEDVDPDKVEFLPLGFDEFYGHVDEEDHSLSKSLKTRVKNALRSFVDGWGKWIDEQKKASEAKMELLQKELELVEAELALKEAIEDLDEELKRMQKEEEDKAEEVVEEEDTSISEPSEKSLPETEEEEEEEDEEDDDNIPSSFGSVEDQKSVNTEQKGNNSGKSTFAASSLSFAGSSLVSLVPQKLQNSFLRWKQGKLQKPSSMPTSVPIPENQFRQLAPQRQSFYTGSFSPAVSKSLKLKCAKQKHHIVLERKPKLSSRNCSKRKASVVSENFLEPLNILSLHAPLPL